jgi:hypothetical protein
MPSQAAKTRFLSLATVQVRKKAPQATFSNEL